jgi:hypothetical protein
MIFHFFFQFFCYVKAWMQKKNKISYSSAHVPKTTGEESNAGKLWGGRRRLKLSSAVLWINIMYLL